MQLLSNKLILRKLYVPDLHMMTNKSVTALISLVTLTFDL